MVDKRRTYMRKYALVALLALICVTVNAWAGTENVLWNFISAPKGFNSASSVISDAAGNLYGTTQLGGLHGFGTVFKLTPQTDGRWTETVVYSFPGGGSGNSPVAGLVMDAAGNLYGTTSYGGSLQGNCQSGGCGTVFELMPLADGSWEYKRLHAFQFDDGSTPESHLVFDPSGNLFGTTLGGGYFSSGTVFELSPGAKGEWKEAVLWSFQQAGEPRAGLIFDGDGNLYGTTTEGPNGADSGTVFKLSPGAGGKWTETVLYNFCGQSHCADGAFPVSGLIFDQAGNLYGTTAAGGTSKGGGDGVVFELAPGAGGSWRERVLFTFHGGKEGWAPFGGVVFDTAGNLYGTTIWGGDGGSACQQDGFGCGTVFELTPTSDGWTESIVHAFRAGGDGDGPIASLIIDEAEISTEQPRLPGSRPASTVAGRCLSSALLRAAGAKRCTIFGPPME
jgi:uncharacterized repeat protein (TIGR03803 family)